MGTLMQERLIGGQIIYPFLGEDWQPDPARKADLLALVAAIDARARPCAGACRSTLAACWCWRATKPG